jgi:hypothetical protein
LNGEKKLIDSAKRRATILLAVAHRLIDPAVDVVENAELASIIAKEVQRVEQGRDHLMPAWLGEPTASFLKLDYSHFRPVGVYTRSRTQQTKTVCFRRVSR